MWRRRLFCLLFEKIIGQNDLWSEDVSGNVNGHPRLVALGMSEPEEITGGVALMNEVTEETGIVTTNEGRA